MMAGADDRSARAVTRTRSIGGRSLMRSPAFRTASKESQRAKFGSNGDVLPAHLHEERRRARERSRPVLPLVTSLGLYVLRAGCDGRVRTRRPIAVPACAGQEFLRCRFNHQA